MLRFTLERFIGMIVTMALVSVMVFLIMEIPPGDYADRYAFRKYSGTGVNVTEADVQAIRVDLGLDKPMVLRYFDWIGGIVGKHLIRHLLVAKSPIASTAGPTHPGHTVVDSTPHSVVCECGKTRPPIGIKVASCFGQTNLAVRDQVIVVDPHGNTAIDLGRQGVHQPLALFNECLMFRRGLVH